MSKQVLISKHIHSCFASFSTSDRFGYISTTIDELDFECRQESTIKSKKFPLLNGEKIKRFEGDDLFLLISLESNTEFYYKALHCRGKKGLPSFDKDSEYLALIQSYADKGWDMRAAKNFAGFDDYMARCRKIELEERKAAGLLLISYDEYSGHPEMFQGGFSDSVFNSPNLKKYIGDGKYVHGWMGHSGARKSWHDKIIEDGLRLRGISDDGMYNWLSSSDGRHFGDSIEGMSDEQQKDCIENKLNSMFDNIIIYNFPKHNGTLNSTHAIEKELSGKNIFLEEGEPGENGPKKLLLYAMEFIDNTEFSPEERKQILSIISPSVVDMEKLKVKL